jgi:hypothetical protein
VIAIIADFLHALPPADGILFTNCPVKPYQAKQSMYVPQVRGFESFY